MADKKKQIQKNKLEEKSPVRRGKTSKGGSSPDGKRKVEARYKDANSSPQKMRLVVNMIRGKDVDEAINILNFTNKKAAKTLLKLLDSAIANSDNQHGIGAEKLFVSSIDVGDGIKLPRYRFASRGRISRLTKRRSLIKIELTEK